MTPAARRQQWIQVWGWIGWVAEKDLLLADLFDRQWPEVRPRRHCRRLA